MNADTTEADISVSRSESECVLKLQGSLQLEIGRRLHEAALEIAANDRNVIVDCSQLAHLDGSSAQVLLALKLALERANGTLSLRQVPEPVEKYLGWAGLTAQFPRVAAADAGRPSSDPRAPRERKRRPRKPAL